MQFCVYCKCVIFIQFRKSHDLPSNLTLAQVGWLAELDNVANVSCEIQMWLTLHNMSCVQIQRTEAKVWGDNVTYTANINYIILTEVSDEHTLCRRGQPCYINGKPKYNSTISLV